MGGRTGTGESLLADIRAEVDEATAGQANAPLKIRHVTCVDELVVLAYLDTDEPAYREGDDVSTATEPLLFCVSDDYCQHFGTGQGFCLLDDYLGDVSFFEVLPIPVTGEQPDGYELFMAQRMAAPYWNDEEDHLDG